MIKKAKYIIILFGVLSGFNLFSQSYNVNYEENKVNHYYLPPITTAYGGFPIKNTQDWEKFRRSEILNAFTNYVYGKIPGLIDTMKVIVRENNAPAFNGLAKRKQVTLILEKSNKNIKVDLLIYLPALQKKSSVFLAYNFFGNHTITDDKKIYMTKSWLPKRPNFGIDSHIAKEQTRGLMKHRWPVEKMIRAGYGLVTLYNGDIDPDKDDFSDGVHSLFYHKDQNTPGEGEWGTIAAWSWGLSRVMDYLETDDEINNEKVIVFGHSRLGKAALWAAASDERFAGCISNNSGCMGASLSRRNFGETIQVINKAFPHWFCGNFKKYTNKEYMLPVDQHMLLSLIAPRPIYVASATEDLWADPQGEFLSLKEASSVYNLYGFQGLSSIHMPEPDKAIVDKVSYHIRTGKHNVTEYDWECYLNFAEFNKF